ncbi:MAG: sensor histidine kinase, partial [Actinoallomurus sp.]
MRVHALSSALRRSGVWSASAVADAIVAFLLLVAGLGVLAASSHDAAPAIAVASIVVMAGAVALRRRLPTLTALAALVGLVGYELTTHDPWLASPPVAWVLTFYTLGRWGAPGRYVWRLVLMAGVGLAATWPVSVQLANSRGNAVASWLFAVVAPLTVGVVFARRSRLSRRLADAAAQLRAEQDHNAAHATAEERNRIARELHDVVAHCVSVMVVQAGAARLVAAHDPVAADRALSAIGDCGRDAMTDLRRIVGVLRRTDDPDFGRGAGLGDLGPLIDRIQAAGVPTELHIGGSTDLPPAVDVVAFRVVQEALTNVVKHAGEGATADVAVRMSTDAVIIEVTNTHVGARPQFTPSGHGLTGMKERVTAYGGDLRAGPRPSGGYGVRAEIPSYLADSRGVGETALSRRQAMRPSQWISNRIASALIVSVWLVAMEIEAATSSARHGPWLPNAVAVAAMALAAGWRRRSPLLYLLVVGGLAAALSGGLTSLDRSTITGLYSLAVPLFAVAAWEPRTRAIVGLALWAAAAGSLAVVHKGAAGGLAGALVVSVLV